MTMKFEYDEQADALYIQVREGEVSRTLEVDEGVYVDLDAERRPLGLEFIALAAFDDWIKRHGALKVPEHVEGRESFLAPA